jgi:copper chaperone CopZ
MDSKPVTIVFQVTGMSCPSCELKIENVLRKMDGVKEVKASLVKSQVKISYDSSILGEEKLKAAILKLGYEVNTSNDSESNKSEKKKSINQLIGIGIIIFALYLIIKSTIGFNFIPRIDKSVGYGMLFVIGLLTSLHCIAMCGGINLSQSVSYQQSGNETGFAKLKPSLLYNTGRVISYTIIGGIVGALGSVISFSGTAKGVVAIAGGVFMVIIGINMLDIFPWLRKIRISTPKFFGN